MFVLFLSSWLCLESLGITISKWQWVSTNFPFASKGFNFSLYRPLNKRRGPLLMPVSTTALGFRPKADRASDEQRREARKLRCTVNGTAINRATRRVMTEMRKDVGHKAVISDLEGVLACPSIVVLHVHIYVKISHNIYVISLHISTCIHLLQFANKPQHANLLGS